MMGRDQVNLPLEVMADSLQNMINFVYPPAQPAYPNLIQDPTYMSERCCLTPQNEDSHEINDLILQNLQTPVHIYLSTDRVVTDNPEEGRWTTKTQTGTQGRHFCNFTS